MIKEKKRTRSSLEVAVGYWCGCHFCFLMCLCVTFPKAVLSLHKSKRLVHNSLSFSCWNQGQFLAQIYVFFTLKVTVHRYFLKRIHSQEITMIETKTKISPYSASTILNLLIMKQSLTFLYQVLVDIFVYCQINVIVFLTTFRQITVYGIISGFTDSIMVVLQWLYNLRIQYFNSLLTMLPKFCSLMTLMSELLRCFKNPYSLKIIKSMNLKWKHFPDVINITPTIWKALLYLFQHILMQFITHTLLEIVLNWV